MHDEQAPSPSRRRLLIAFGSAAGLGACAQQPAAPEPQARVRVKVFPGAQNLGLFAAAQQGFFARRNLDVDLQFTQNSVELRNGLASGAFEIAHAAVDNAVAMRDPGGQDVVILSGGDNSMNELFVQPEITAISQLRGKTLIVDAPNTAYALQAKKILKDRGLASGDYTLKEVGGTFQRIRAMQQDKSNTASMLNPPFSLQALASGLRSLGKVSDLLGPYQASGAFAMRPWAQANSGVVERYLAAWIEGTRWGLNPANREPAIALLAQRLQLERPLAESTYGVLASGLARDAAFDAPGFARLLAIRAEMEGQWGGTPPPQDRFVDLRWYQGALRRVG
ncbi:ABC transporter substrate-binding protein [Ramlibacter sp. AN1133]|uniref:ABC transporter substrate-binding protein n=1 Tax=Ramlibacter sp. AN1133 TaxID=3133429 RepID=UPI0030C39DF4